MNEKLKLYSLKELTGFGIGYHTLRVWYKDHILIPVTKINKSPKFNYDSFMNACKKHDLNLRIAKEQEIETIINSSKKKVKTKSIGAQQSADEFYKSLTERFVTNRI